MNSIGWETGVEADCCWMTSGSGRQRASVPRVRILSVLVKSFFGFVLKALVLLVVALVSALTAMRFAIHVGEVAVPNLVSKTPAEARADASTVGLPVEVERQYYSDGIAAGKILSQIPPAGTKVRRGWQVRVAVSLGPQRLAIPSVIGETERAAEMNIQRRGLELGALAAMQLPDTPADQVVAQSPPPNATGVSAPKISLLLTAAPPTQAFVMPNFAGQPLNGVKSALQNAGFKVGTMTLSSQPTTVPATPSASSGTIVSQTPAPGEKVLAGTVVNFEVR